MREGVSPATETRVIACCGGMVVVFGAERMTFEVLRVLRNRGASVHCIVNSWENHRIVELVRRLGVGHSIGRYRARLTRRSINPITLFRMAWDVLLTSLGLLRDSLRFRPTHILIPDHTTVLRNALALPLLRLLGVRTVFRLSTSPERGVFYTRLWRFVIAPSVDRLVPNSRFSYRRARECGIPEEKLRLVRNAVSQREPANPTVESSPSGLVDFGCTEHPLILIVGQIGPHKGTQDAVEVVLRLRGRGARLRLAVVGRRPGWPPELVAFTDELEDRIEAAGARDSMRLLGAVDDVLPLMREACLLLAPIHVEEAFGNVVLEARSVGLPVVCSNRGGLPELVSPGKTGFVCSAGDLDCLERAVGAIALDSELRERMSRASLQLAAVDKEVSPASFEHAWAGLFGLASDAEVRLRHLVDHVAR